MSADSVQRQKNFCDKQSFNFPILSDENKDVLKSYGVWGTKKMYGREYEGIYRYTYIIDENGMIEKAFSKVTTKTHAQDVLAELE
jgi:peroxiredoxin Q/BCP|tara:strand:- start:306 stop:560 length:255 start_codon:yes stop_codon:yes gene_type:complete